MAINGFTSHTGSDGSLPALRVQLSGYPGGYGGEATAWGMLEAIEPVRYWLESPSHRQIILNPAAADVGVGFSENFSSPSIWYWTAEFASMNLPVIRLPLPESSTPQPEPTLDLLGPPQGSEFTLSPDTNLRFTWSWPEPLQPDERFAVYVISRGRVVQLGSVIEPVAEGQYEFSVPASNAPLVPGEQQWFVRLEATRGGTMREESAAWSLNFVSQP
jgi:hypothetical protein